MFGKEKSSLKQCAALESKLVEYLDGRARPAERHAVEQHLSGCASCRSRVEEFGALWSALDDLPGISPSPAFDASLRARIAAEPMRRSFWDWLPSPRLAFAVTALVTLSVWLSSAPRRGINPSIPFTCARPFSMRCQALCRNAKSIRASCARWEICRLKRNSRLCGRPLGKIVKHS